MLESIEIFSPGANAGIPVGGKRGQYSAASTKGDEARTQIRAASTPERVPKVTAPTRARHDTAPNLLRASASSRALLLPKAHRNEVVLLLLVEEDLPQSATAVLARLARLLDVAVLALDERRTLQVGVGEEGRFVDRGG